MTTGGTPGRIAAIVDIDGTLVDSNYQHALAWYRAFRGVGVQIGVRRIHRHIGMGGDQLVEALAGEQVEREHGDALREAEGEEFAAMRDEVGLVHDAKELVRALAGRCRAVYLSSSGRPEAGQSHSASTASSPTGRGISTRAPPLACDRMTRAWFSSGRGVRKRRSPAAG